MCGWEAVRIYQEAYITELRILAVLGGSILAVVVNSSKGYYRETWETIAYNGTEIIPVGDFMPRLAQ